MKSKEVEVPEGVEFPHKGTVRVGEMTVGGALRLRSAGNDDEVILLVLEDCLRPPVRREQLRSLPASSLTFLMVLLEACKEVNATTLGLSVFPEEQTSPPA